MFEEDSESESEDKQVKDSIALGRDEEGDDTPNPLQVYKQLLSNRLQIPDILVDARGSACHADLFLEPTVTVCPPHYPCRFSTSRAHAESPLYIGLALYGLINFDIC